MFDIGWTEMLVVACVAIIVVGPKDLPKVLRAFGKTMASVRRMAGDFQKQFDEAIKEAELDDVKNIATGKSFQALDDVKNSALAFQKDVKERMADQQKSLNESNSDDKLPEPAAPALVKTDSVATGVVGTEKSGSAKPALVKSDTSKAGETKVGKAKAAVSAPAKTVKTTVKKTVNKASAAGKKA